MFRLVSGVVTALPISPAVMRYPAESPVGVRLQCRPDFGCDGRACALWQAMQATLTTIVAACAGGARPDCPILTGPSAG